MIARTIIGTVPLLEELNELLADIPDAPAWGDGVTLVTSPAPLTST